MSIKVDVYSSDSCRFCVKLKDWLKEKNIKFTNFDIGEEKIHNFLIEKNVGGIPFVIITNTETGKQTEFSGFDPDVLNEIFN
jgi:glutaredoxin